MKTVYQLDGRGYLLGPTEADESPLEPGVHLIPAGCVEADPPALGDGQRARWTGGAWVVEADLPPEPEPELDPAEKRRRFPEDYPDTAARAKRNRLLTACDWTQLPDAPEADREAWAVYREALRNLPDQEGFPINIVWPAPPA